jgi:hypothetical protein
MAMMAMMHPSMGMSGMGMMGGPGMMNHGMGMMGGPQNNPW